MARTSDRGGDRESQEEDDASVSSLRAVETLDRVDPDFQRLCEVLYGGYVDPQEVWEDVFKRSSPQMTEKQKRERLQARVGLATNYVGLAAGASGTAAAVQQYRAASGKGAKEFPSGVARRTGRGILTPKRLAGAALGLQVANVGGDAVANRVLNRSAKGPQKVKKLYAVRVEKSGMGDGVKRMVNGILQRVGGGAKAGGPTVNSAPNVNSDPLGYAMYNAKATNSTRAQQAKQQKWGDRAESAGRAAADPGGTASRVGSWATNSPGKVVGSTLAVGATGGVMGNARGRKKSSRMSAYGAPQPVYYGKAASPDIKWQGEFSKFDDDKRLAFGWASVVEKDGLPVVDRQGDYIAPEDMETAAYVYVQKSRVGGDMHRRDESDQAVKVSDLVESVVFTKEKIAKMGLPDSTPVGWWVGFKIHDEDTWQTVKKGGHTGFSIHGRGRRQETSVDELHKYHR